MMEWILLIIFVCFVMMISIALFILYRYNQTQHPPCLSKPVRGGNYRIDSNHYPYASDEQRVNGIRLPVGKFDKLTIPSLNDDNSFSVMFWIKPENQMDVTVCLLNRGDSFHLLYNSYDNRILLRFGHRGFQKVFGSNQQEFVVSGKLKIQKWNMVIVAVKNRDVDAYIDGELVSSFLLLNVPYFSPTDEWFLFQDRSVFYGLISCIRYFNICLDIPDAKKLHRTYYHPKKDPSISTWWWWTWYPVFGLEKLFY